MLLVKVSPVGVILELEATNEIARYSATPLSGFTPLYSRNQ